MGTDNVTFGPGCTFRGLKNWEIELGLAIERDIAWDIPIKDEYVDTATFAHTTPPTEAFKSQFEASMKAILDVPVFTDCNLIGDASRGFYMEYDGYKYKQVRRHKKKRINKKWAKRYGYREVPCRYIVENCHIRHERFDDFEIVSDPPKIICSDRYGRFGGK